jgi:hypothetical protein
MKGDPMPYQALSFTAANDRLGNLITDDRLNRTATPEDHVDDNRSNEAADTFTVRRCAI